MIDHDIVIVGAGAAGVGAARRLAAAGLAPLVLEASDRVGGRAFTAHLAGMALDLGCGWLHSADRNPWVGIAEESGFTVTRGPTAWRDQWRDLGFAPAEQEAAEQAMAVWHRRLAEDPPASDRAADALEPGGRWNAYLQALSGYINAATLETVSIADYQAYDAASTDNNWRVREGYGRMIAASLPPVALRLGTPVNAIALEAGGVRIDTLAGPIRARAAIVTVSTAVLASGAIRFDAALDDHLHAATCLPLGLADKVYLELDGGPFEDETHLLGNPRSAETGAYYIRPLGARVIEGFFGGAGARAHERDGIAAACQHAIDELVALVGNDVRRHLRPLTATCWGRTDFIHGSYSHALPGHAAARGILAAPFDDRLHFAGEATHATDFSTAHGAYASGVRAAEAVLAAQHQR